MAPDLWLYFLAVLAVILLPGMDMAYVLASSLSAGRRGAVSAVLGIASGGIIHVVVGATGVAALMSVFPQLFHAMLAAGTIYLVWIGWQIYRSAGAPVPDAPIQTASRAIYGRAIMTCLLNPKAYAFMLAIFPAFVRNDAVARTGSLLAQTTALCVITATTQIAVYGSVAALALRATQFMKARRAQLARAMGAMLIGAALMTAMLAWSSPASAATSAPTDPSLFPTRPTTMHKTVPLQIRNENEKPGRDDFDFQIGNWQVENRRKVKPLLDDSPWETFTANVHMEKFPAAIGNFDTFVAPSWRPNWMGMAVRFFNGETGLWSIYLANSRTGGIVGTTGQLDVPVVGKFDNGTGVFEGDEIFQGVPIRVRFTWSDTRTDHPKWQQDFSFDGGKTWKPNWFMTYTRMKPDH